jgi:hypothetical protein
MLVGAKCAWTEKGCQSERDSVLAWASLDNAVREGGGAANLALEGGHVAGADVNHAVLHARGGSGQPVEVAICHSDPSPKDSSMVWYEIRVWNPVARDWENPCIPTADAPNPRALVIGGTWDDTGAHHDDPRKVTFACEGGDIAKCADWGYRPWVSRGGRSLADAHQACTRMARADYCGNGRSHTREKVVIDYYDSLGVEARSDDPSLGWKADRAAFEACWSVDGATCLARTRDGEELAAIMQECPGRFTLGGLDLGEGDKAILRRSGPGAPVVLLKNRMQR